jgi:glutaredoxin 3
MTDKHNITIFTTETCSFCKGEKEFLKEHNIKFKEVDVGKDSAAAQKLVEKTGQMSVPVTDIDGEFIVGFDKDKLSKLLNISN